MTTYDFIFYVFAAIIVVSAFIVVAARNIIYSAFSLLFTFFGVAGIYVLLNADFIAVVQVIIYVGGILVLIIFGVMLTNKITDVEIKTESIHIVPATIITGLIGGTLIAVLTKTNWKIAEPQNVNKTVMEIGRFVVVHYMILFELAGIILLVALIGSVMIARREKVQTDEVQK
ncbi:MAG: NADH-quinone oxidoreductase subunit J [Ignavibacteria bacterium]|jgi:NADH-quinone oxidoreductase subunit J|nr:NADH-quinone oxidoreductase subunit J [Ignavibacteria bacterium]MDH7528388.1 NADH-quinone oxidoreductase subunit J [Ignavibacteria bacterium]